MTNPIANLQQEDPTAEPLLDKNQVGSIPVNTGGQVQAPPAPDPAPSPGIELAPISPAPQQITTPDQVLPSLGAQAQNGQVNTPSTLVPPLPGSDTAIQSQQGLIPYPKLYSPNLNVPSLDNTFNAIQADATRRTQNFNSLLEAGNEAVRNYDVKGQPTVPNANGSGGAFDWVKNKVGSFLGQVFVPKEKNGRQYTQFRMENGQINAIGDILYGLSLAQNAAIGIGLDANNLASQYVPPWVKSNLLKVQDYVHTVVPSVATAQQQTQFGKQFNDGRSNFVEALRGAQYSFSDPKLNAAVANDKGFSVTVPGTSWKIPVNFSVLGGVATDVFVGAKVDSLIAGAGKGVAALTKAKPPELPPSIPAGANPFVPQNGGLNPSMIRTRNPVQSQLGNLTGQVSPVPVHTVAVPRAAIPEVTVIAAPVRAERQLIPINVDTTTPQLRTPYNSVLAAEGYQPLNLPPKFQITDSSVIGETHVFHYLVPGANGVKADIRHFIDDGAPEIELGWSVNGGYSKEAGNEITKAEAKQLKEAFRQVVELNPNAKVYAGVDGGNLDGFAQTRLKMYQRSGFEVSNVEGSYMELVLVDRARFLGTSRSRSLNQQINNVPTLVSPIRPSTELSTVSTIVNDVRNSVSVQAQGAVASLTQTDMMLQRANQVLQIATENRQNVIANLEANYPNTGGRQFISASVPDRPFIANARAFDPAVVIPPSAGTHYHGTRVPDIQLNQINALDGGSRSELGVGVYISNKPEIALSAANASPNINAPAVSGRDFGETPFMHSMGIAPDAKLIAAGTRSDQLTGLANHLAAASFPEISDAALVTRKSYTEILDTVAKEIPDEQTQREFQKQFAMLLMDNGYDGVRTSDGEIVNMFNNRKIIPKTVDALPPITDQSGITALRERFITEQHASVSLSGGSQIAEVNALEAKAHLFTQQIHEGEKTVAQLNQQAADAVDATGLLRHPDLAHDFPTTNPVDDLAEQIDTNAPEISEPQTFNPCGN